MLLAAALGGGIPFKERKPHKQCSRCLKPFDNRGAYCKECHEDQANQAQAGDHSSASQDDALHSQRDAAEASVR